MKEAAGEIKRSPQFIYGLIYEGEIPDREQKGRRIVLESDLNDWVKKEHDRPVSKHKKSLDRRSAR